LLGDGIRLYDNPGSVPIRLHLLCGQRLPLRSRDFGGRARRVPKAIGR
jgi:hypothetical protein